MTKKVLVSYSSEPTSNNTYKQLYGFYFFSYEMNLCDIIIIHYIH